MWSPITHNFCMPFEVMISDVYINSYENLPESKVSSRGRHKDMAWATNLALKYRVEQNNFTLSKQKLR
jgi:hypothetical protein